jgi:hypothetical protein
MQTRLLLRRGKQKRMKRSRRRLRGRQMLTLLPHAKQRRRLPHTEQTLLRLLLARLRRNRRLLRGRPTPTPRLQGRRQARPAPCARRRRQ